MSSWDVKNIHTEELRVHEVNICYCLVWNILERSCLPPPPTPCCECMEVTNVVIAWTVWCHGFDLYPGTASFTLQASYAPAGAQVSDSKDCSSVLKIVLTLLTPWKGLRDPSSPQTMS